MDLYKNATENNECFSEDDAMKVVREKYQEVLERDILTGVFNRRGFYAHTSQLLRENASTEYEICCVNIDKFKVVNDLFGTFSGDRLLNYMAKMLREYVGDEGMVARLNADNFAICLKKSDNLHEEFSSALSGWFAEYPIGISIITRCGFYIVTNRELPVSVMCDRANLAIAEIKGSYDRNYAVYDERIRNRILEEQEVINEMKIALEEKQFKVYYQPKFNMESGKLIGAEALVRWQHPSKGMISPGVFIPIFEKNGFISDLDRYVWEMTCQDIRAWMDMDLYVCPISVNVSRAELYNKDLGLYLLSLIDKYDIPIQFLQLEITESAYTDSPDQIIEIVQELKDKGFTILMDDFGSGYSSLNILKDLPVDILKIDLKFLYKMDGNKKANYILKSVVQMAKRLELSVIAEGVEAENQADFLKSIGCVRAQGYLYARPLPESDFRGYMESQEHVSLNDEDIIDGLVNIDDVLAGYHREDELEWYRAAVIQLNAMLYEYDIENDIFMLYDMQANDESRELDRMEIPSFIKALDHGTLVHKADAKFLKAEIEQAKCQECDIRIKNIKHGKGYRWYRQEGRILLNSMGIPKSMVGVLRNIDDEKASDVLLESLTMLEEDFDNLLNGNVLAKIAESYVADIAAIFFAGEGYNQFSDGMRIKREGELQIKYDQKQLLLMDKVFAELETDEYGVTYLTEDSTQINEDIRKILFSKGEKNAVVIRQELGDNLPSINLILGYVETSKNIILNDSKNLAELLKCIVAVTKKYISEMIEQRNNSLYSLAFQTSGVRLYEWDIITKELHRSAMAVDDARGEWVANVPESYLGTGDIHPDYESIYKEAYEEIERGYDTSLMVKKKNCEGEYEWIRVSYRVIRDETGLPIKAIGFSEDVNQVSESQRKVREKIRMLRELRESELIWFKVNLTADRIVGRAPKLQMLDKGPYQESIERIAAEYVIDGLKEHFIKMLSRDSLIEKYKNGIQCVSEAYGVYIDENREKVQFRDAVIDISKDEYGDIIAFYTLYVIDEQKKYEQYADREVVVDRELGLYEADSFKSIARGIVEKFPDKLGALIIVDMDRFLLIKSAFGDEYCREITRSIVSVMKAVSPTNAIIGKLLSDRFAIFIPECPSYQEMFSVFNRVQKSIYSSFTVDKQNYVLSASAGMAYTEFFRGDFDGLMKEAQNEMLKAKEYGR